MVRIITSKQQRPPRHETPSLLNIHQVTTNEKEIGNISPSWILKCIN